MAKSEGLRNWISWEKIYDSRRGTMTVIESPVRHAEDDIGPLTFGAETDDVGEIA